MIFLKNCSKVKICARSCVVQAKKNYTRAISFIKDKNVRPYDYTNSIGQILLDRFSIKPKETLLKNTGWDNSIAKLFN